MARGIRLILKLAVLLAALWVAQRALKRWIDGPDVAPDTAPWPSLGEEPVAPAPAVEAGVAAVAEEGVETEPNPQAPPAKPPSSGKAAQGRIVPAKRATAAKKAAPASAAPASAAPAKANPAKPSAKRVATARIVPAPKKRGSGKRTWVRPGPDGCPPTHPVKAKLSSMIYHLPGMASYARTVPDRCYATGEEAEADGFARAKR